MSGILARESKPPGQSIFYEPIIGIEKRYPFARGMIHTRIARSSGPTVLLMPQDADAGIAQLRGERECRLRSIVNDDQLKIINVTLT
jgi:hypothetical protein